MKTAILTDSNSGISPEEGERWGTMATMNRFPSALPVTPAPMPLEWERQI